MKVLFVLALAILVYGIFARVRRRHSIPKHASAWVVPRRKLTRGRILFLTTGGKVIASLIISACLCALFIVLYLGGRMTIIPTVGSCAFVIAFIVFFLVPVVDHNIKPLLPLLHGRESKSLLANATFRFVHGCWQYIDEDWFVRVGSADSCVLYAPQIDFWVLVRPVHLNYIKWQGDNAEAYQLQGVHFGKVGHGAITVCTELDEELTKWVKAHGGMVQEMEE